MLKSLTKDGKRDEFGFCQGNGENEAKNLR